MTRHDQARPAVQVAYASADLGVNAVETVLRLYPLIFYTDVVGLRPGLAGLAVALGLVWDAVTDPVMGAVSDRLRHRFGGRRFFVLVGSVLLAAGLLLVFRPPDLGSQGARFAWLLGSYVFLNLGLTVMAIPHTAMSAELTVDPHGRSVLFGWRFAFANAGALLAAALPVALDTSDEPATGGVDALRTVAVLVALLVIAGGVTTWTATRSLPRASRQVLSKVGLRALLTPLRSATFRPLVAAYVVATIGVGMNAAVALYYYGHHLELSDRQIQVMLVVFLGVFTASLAGWVRLSRQRGKLRPLVAGACLLGLATSVLYPTLPPGNFVLPLLIGAVGLGSLVGCIVLIDSLLTDVIDHDRLRRGHQRAGLFFGLWRFAAKLARAVAIGIAGLVLDAVGFDASHPPDASVHNALKLLFGPGVGVFFLAAGVILARYRFDDKKQRQVRRLLERRAERAAQETRRNA